MAYRSLHELTPAYALDALDERDVETYEEHLSGCPDCREELASLTEAATALVYAVEAPPPPLRGGPRGSSKRRRPSRRTSCRSCAGRRSRRPQAWPLSPPASRSP